MSIVLDCYSYIIGLSRTDCSECYTIPSDASLSYSGLYLDELESLRVLSSLENCENGNEVFTLMDRARDESVRMFVADTNAMLQKNYQLKRRPFYGSIGRTKTSQAHSLTAGYYAGSRWSCADIVGGTLILKNIGTIFNTTGTITLFIYNNLNELVATETLNTVANVHTLNSVNIELPLHANYIDNLEYFFVYQVGASMPLNNDVHCNCGRFRPVFDTRRPYWTQTNKQYGWAEWAMVGGYYDSSISDLDQCGYSASNYLYGLTFQVELKCKLSEVLCEDYLDFEANPLAMAMASAIRYKAGELLVNKILLSPNLNRDTMINAEALAASRDVYKAKYEELLGYIIDRVDVTTNDCLECRDLQEVLKSGIFS